MLSLSIDTSMSSRAPYRSFNLKFDDRILFVGGGGAAIIQGAFIRLAAFI